MACQTQRPDNTWPNPVDRLRQEFEKLVEGVMTQGGRAIDMVGLKDLTRPSVFAADILESPEQLQVFVDIAGIDPAQVEITLVGNMLTLKVDRPKVTVTDAQVLHRNERAAGMMTRSLPLPVAVDPNKVSAEAKQGVLVITLPKEEKSKPHTIRVQVSPATGTVS